MHKEVKKYIANNQLFTSEDKILIATSGGRDSIVLAYLLKELNYSIGLAHCNFGLRGDDSDKDEQFVKDLAKSLSIPFYSVLFDTKKYSGENNLSIQMAARELRYDWLEKVREEDDYDYIATAHHKNDVAETMLINLTKGTGLAGLHGILNKNNLIVRPLLCLDRKEINQFVELNKISYREDQSNRETKYVRNSIRHDVIPSLEKINPSVVQTLNEEAEVFKGIEELVQDVINKLKQELFKLDGEYVYISLEDIKKLSPQKTYLYYLLSEFGVNASQVNDIVGMMDDISGKTITTEEYIILKDRDQLIVKPNDDQVKSEMVIHSVEDFDQLSVKFKWSFVDDTNNISFENNTKIAYLDYNKLSFPLVLRKWENGDEFYPLGMKGVKKISDFFIDNKLTLFEKKDAWILTSNDEIVWILPHRIDERFKISEDTKKALRLEYC